MKIHGGLGNQMFQYALGRHLAMRNKTNLKLDLSFYVEKNEKYTLREFQLDLFNTQLDFANENEINELLGWCGFRKFNKLLNRLGINLLPHYYYEKSHRFQSDVSSLKDNFYLDGYWQTPQYFEDIEANIRQEFVFKEAVSINNQGLLEKITTTESVAIHIRRGDYLNNPLHNVFDMRYIEQGIEFMQNKLGNTIQLFIFSDDLIWCSENLTAIYPHISKFFCNGGSPKEDLQLMSNCKHFIIANSSFSWWAAWLGNNAHKIVVAPQKWFNGNKRDSSDILPKAWVKL